MKFFYSTISSGHGIKSVFSNNSGDVDDGSRDQTLSYRRGVPPGSEWVSSPSVLSVKVVPWIGYLGHSCHHMGANTVVFQRPALHK